MEIIRLSVGLLATNCYILYLPLGKGQPTEGFVIDPGGDCEQILGVLKRYNIQVRAIINTHGHADHILCNEILRMAVGCEVWMSKEEADIAADAEKNLSEYVCTDGNAKSGFCFAGVDRYLEDGESIKLGNKPVLRTIILPGHSPGGIGLITINKRYAFLGDLIFEQGYGRTDMYGGDAKALKMSLERIRKEILPQTVVCAGHGELFKGKVVNRDIDLSNTSFGNSEVL